jgi:hypothetical protein
LAPDRPKQASRDLRLNDNENGFVLAIDEDTGSGSRLKPISDSSWKDKERDVSGPPL